MAKETEHKALVPTEGAPQIRDGKLKLDGATRKLLEAMGHEVPEGISEITVDVEHSKDTKKILVPDGMNLLDAAKELQTIHKTNEEKINMNATFDNWNWKDALVAIKRVTETNFGHMNSKTRMTFFGPQRPNEIEVVVDLKKGKEVTEQAFFGVFEISCWENAEANISVNGGEVSIKITGKRKYSPEVNRYFEAIRYHLKTSSIYRGRNIVVTSKEVFGSQQIDFEIIENKGSDKIILNEREETVIKEFVLGTLNENDKRCYLFTGDFGTGKTESAMRVGREAVSKHGMSFFYVKDAKVFDVLLNQCKQYQPCVIFLEDIDEIASGNQRDAEMNKILNTLDGVQTKGNNLTVILTTNNPQKINSALRRPGRIDMIVKFENPDDDAKKKIFTSYFDVFTGFATLDWEKILHHAPNAQGAVIAEISKRAVQRAKIKGFIDTDLVVASIGTMHYQLQLMKGEVEEVTKEKQIFNLLADLLSIPVQVGMGKTINGKVDKIAATVGA